MQLKGVTVMLPWLIKNLATILISLVIVCIVVFIIAKLRKDRKAGKSTCGGNGGHCPMGGSCHKK